MGVTASLVYGVLTSKDTWLPLFTQDSVYYLGFASLSVGGLNSRERMGFAERER